MYERSRAVALALVFCATLWSGAALADTKRPYRIEDSISFSHFGGFFGYPAGMVASPSGDRAAVYVTRADAAANTNVTELRIYVDNGRGHEPLEGATRQFISHDNLAAIESIAWEDETTLVYLAKDGSGIRQAFRYHIDSQREEQLTRHAQSVTAARRIGKHLVFTADRPDQSSYDLEAARRSGLRVDRRMIDEVLTGSKARTGENPSQALFVQREDGPVEVKLPKGWLLDPGWFNALDASPDARHALVMLFSLGESDTEFPAAWQGSHTGIKAGPIFTTYVLDAQGAELRVVESDRPLLVEEGKWTRSRRFHAYVNAPCRDEKGTWIDYWTCDQWVVEFDPVTASFKKLRVAVEKARRDHSAKPIRSRTGSQLVVRQSMHERPTLVRTLAGREQVLWDPNAYLDQVQLVAPELIEWKDADGHDYKAGLYVSPQRVASERLPLIIQTHGWDVESYDLDGLGSPSGYVAQGAVSMGAIVVQMSDQYIRHAMDNRELESTRGIKCLDALIDMLDARGLIDTSRIALQTFSRTGVLVRALYDAKHRFAAAVVVDSMQLTPLQAFSAPGHELNARFMRDQVGAFPIGDGIRTWIDLTPTFNAHRIDTPVLTMAFGLSSMLNSWEFYSALRYQRPDHEFLYIPDADHNPRLPSQRRAVMDATLRWYAKWLKLDESKVLRSIREEKASRSH